MDRVQMQASYIRKVYSATTPATTEAITTTAHSTSTTVTSRLYTPRSTPSDSTAVTTPGPISVESTATTTRAPETPTGHSLLHDVGLLTATVIVTVLLICCSLATVALIAYKLLLRRQDGTPPAYDRACYSVQKEKVDLGNAQIITPFSR